MKKWIGIIMGLLLAISSSAFAADITISIDYAAFDEFAASWNLAAEQSNTPIFFSSVSNDGGLWVNCFSDSDEPTTIVDSLSNSSIPLPMIMNYWPEDDCFSLYYAQKDLTEMPSALSFYIDGIKHEAIIQQHATGEDADGDMLSMAITRETADAIIAAQECFLRLTTDKDSYFLDVNYDATPVPYTMFTVLYSGFMYSSETSQHYKDEALLWKPESDDTSAETSSSEKITSFQTDYEAIDRAAQSVFLLEVYDEKAQLIATGSGFLAFDNGTLVTNEHVIEGGSYVIAYSDHYAASYKLSDVKIADKEKDIAILVFDSSARIEPLHVDFSSRILRGQPVTAIGSPKGVINTVSSGNISNIIYHSESIPEYIQFTAPISPGSSGGALFNESGSVIGLCVSYLKEAEAMYYAIPMKYVEEVYQQAKTISPIPLSLYNTLPDMLSAPVLSKLQSTENSIVLEWPVVPNVESYKVYRRTSIRAEFTPIATVEDPFYSDQDIEAGIIYQYCVRAYYGWKGLSAPSNIQSAEISLPEAPQPTPVTEGMVLYRFGAVNDIIFSVKVRLYELGYFYADKSFDNKFDADLQSALQSFQRLNNLKETGNLDTNTLDAINSPSAQQGPWTIPAEVKQLSQNTYQFGDKCDEIILIKKQLQEMGYYRSSSALDKEYNKTMVERVQQFQKNNRLEATGIIDYVTLIKLFYKDAQKGNWYTKPTPTPKPEKSITLEIPNDSYGEWKYLSGDKLKIRIQVENVSAQKTVIAYELYAYTVDVWGNRLLPEKEVYTLSVESTLKPGQKRSSSYITLPNRSKIDRVYVAISKVKYSDGTTVSVPYHNYSYWTID